MAKKENGHHFLKVVPISSPKAKFKLEDWLVIERTLVNFVVELENSMGPNDVYDHMGMDFDAREGHGIIACCSKRSARLWKEIVSVATSDKAIGTTSELTTVQFILDERFASMMEDKKIARSTLVSNKLGKTGIFPVGRAVDDRRCEITLMMCKDDAEALAKCADQNQGQLRWPGGRIGFKTLSKSPELSKRPSVTIVNETQTPLLQKMLSTPPLSKAPPKVAQKQEQKSPQAQQTPEQQQKHQEQLTQRKPTTESRGKILASFEVALEERDNDRLPKTELDAHLETEKCQKSDLKTGIDEMNCDLYDYLMQDDLWQNTVKNEGKVKEQCEVEEVRDSARDCERLSIANDFITRENEPSEKGKKKKLTKKKQRKDLSDSSDSDDESLMDKFRPRKKKRRISKNSKSTSSTASDSKVGSVDVNKTLLPSVVVERLSPNAIDRACKTSSNVRQPPKASRAKNAVALTSFSSGLSIPRRESRGKIGNQKIDDDSDAFSKHKRNSDRGDSRSSNSDSDNEHQDNLSDSSCSDRSSDSDNSCIMP